MGAGRGGLGFGQRGKFTRSGLEVTYLLAVALPPLYTYGCWFELAAGEDVEMPTCEMGRNIGHGRAGKFVPTMDGQQTPNSIRHVSGHHDGDHDFGRLTVRVLGRFEGTKNGEQVKLGPVRQQAVLLPLVLRPSGTVTPEEIVDGVWGEEVPVSGIELVRTYVSRLRSILGRDMIGRCAAGYYIQLDECQVDLTAFNQRVIEARQLRRCGRLGPSAVAWREALRLWRGPPLPRLPGPFAERQRQRLTDLHLSVLEECWDTEILLGRHAELLVELSAIVRDQPLRENLARLLMLALCRSGRPADAIAVFEQTRRQLSDELGVEPAASLQELHNRIRSGDSELM